MKKSQHRLLAEHLLRSFDSFVPHLWGNSHSGRPHESLGFDWTRGKAAGFEKKSSSYVLWFSLGFLFFEYQNTLWICFDPNVAILKLRAGCKSLKSLKGNICFVASCWLHDRNPSSGAGLVGVEWLGKSFAGNQRICWHFGWKFFEDHEELGNKETTANWQSQLIDLIARCSFFKDWPTVHQPLPKKFAVSLRLCFISCPCLPFCQGQLRCRH